MALNPVQQGGTGPLSRSEPLSLPDVPVLTCLPGERRGYAPGPVGLVHYREMGGGRPLLLAHQAPWSSIQYHKVMPLLAAQGFHVIVPDMPGHGMSDPTPGDPTIALYAECAAAVLDALGIDRAVAAGQHGGALVAGRLAATQPGRITRLAMDNAPFYTAGERAERAARRTQGAARLRPDGAHFTERWASVRQFGDPEWSDETVHMAVTTVFINGPWADQGFLAGASHDFRPDLEAIRCPTLVVGGRRDMLYAHAARILALRPDFDQAEFPGGPAMVYEHVDIWSRTIGGYLAR